jgi:hypothetical protein
VKKKGVSRRGKKGADGLTDRERKFVAERRKDPAALGHEIAKRAGYSGDAQKLSRRAGDLMRKPEVSAAIYSPDRKEKETEPDDESLKLEVRRVMRAILNSPRTSDSDKIKAGDKILATIVGGYVPMQVQQKGSFTLESIVARMGGAPDEIKLLEEENTDAKELRAVGGP